LKNKLTDGKMIVENPNRPLADLDFCRKGQASELTTIRFAELLKNIAD
jgi:hypothetical protein